MNTATFNQKPTRTIRIGEAKIKAILDRLDGADHAGINPSAGGHYAYRAKSAALACMQQPGGGIPATFHCPTRHIRNARLGCLHGGYVHPGTRCFVQLFTTHGTWQDMDGLVDTCTHANANVHELCIRFDDEIDPGLFCLTAVRHRVLLIEENTSLARLAIHDLQALNAQVEHVTDGRTAVESALKNNYDLVLLDIELSDMDRLEAMRELRSAGYTDTLAAFTALNDPEERQGAVEAAFDLHVSKPYLRQDLSRLLERLMEEPIYSSYHSDPQSKRVFLKRQPGRSDLVDELLDDTVLRTASTLALAHHKRWDGTGYPARLPRDQIPLVARIVALADVYDALPSQRPYTAAYSGSDTLHIMKREVERHFDPEVCAAFEQSVEEFTFIRSEVSNESRSPAQLECTV